MLDGNNPAVVTAMAGAALRLVECGLVVPRSAQRPSSGSRKATQADLARSYGVSQTTISRLNPAVSSKARPASPRKALSMISRLT